MDAQVGRRVALGDLGRVALLPPAAFAVHQLRYELAFGAGAGAQLRETGHAYLHSVVPWLVALMALAAGAFLVSLGRAFARHTRVSRFTVSFGGLWIACTVALVAIFTCQELMEGLIATGHPGGLAGVFGYGGWWSIPAAVCLGLVLAALFHGARWVVRQVSRLRGAPLRGRRAQPGFAAPASALLSQPAPLLSGWSTRGPPLRG